MFSVVPAYLPPTTNICVPLVTAPNSALGGSSNGVPKLYVSVVMSYMNVVFLSPL